MEDEPTPPPVKPDQLRRYQPPESYAEWCNRWQEWRDEHGNARPKHRARTPVPQDDADQLPLF
jgi:hypothetical protein